MAGFVTLYRTKSNQSVVGLYAHDELPKNSIVFMGDAQVGEVPLIAFLRENNSGRRLRNELPHAPHHLHSGLDRVEGFSGSPDLFAFIDDLEKGLIKYSYVNILNSAVAFIFSLSLK